MNKQEIKFLQEKYGITPRKQQGQNFLLDEQAVQASIDAGNLTKEDTVLEIGPGFGALTTHIAEAAGQVIAVEQDRDLARAITDIKKQYDNITLYNEDVRTFNGHDAGLKDLEYKLVANLPYSITSWILKHFLDHAPRPNTFVVMVQKEVAERICAAPGKMSVLAVAVQAQATAEIVQIVPAESFSPVPKVDSAILRITRTTDSEQSNVIPDWKGFMRLVRMGFAQKRKRLTNNLANGLQISKEEAAALLEQTGLPAQSRPQELSIEEWKQLFTTVSKVAN